MRDRGNFCQIMKDEKVFFSSFNLCDTSTIETSSQDISRAPLGQSAKLNCLKTLDLVEFG